MLRESGGGGQVVSVGNECTYVNFKMSSSNAQ